MTHDLIVEIMRWARRAGRSWSIDGAIINTSIIGLVMVGGFP